MTRPSRWPARPGPRLDLVEGVVLFRRLFGCTFTTYAAVAAGEAVKGPAEIPVGVESSPGSCFSRRPSSPR